MNNRVSLLVMIGLLLCGLGCVTPTSGMSSRKVDGESIYFEKGVLATVDTQEMALIQVKKGSGLSIVGIDQTPYGVRDGRSYYGLKESIYVMPGKRQFKFRVEFVFASNRDMLQVAEPTKSIECNAGEAYEIGYKIDVSNQTVRIVVNRLSSKQMQ